MREVDQVHEFLAVDFLAALFSRSHTGSLGITCPQVECSRTAETVARDQDGSLLSTDGPAALRDRPYAIVAQPV